MAYATVKVIVAPRGGDTLGILQVDDAIADLATRPDVVKHPAGSLFIQTHTIDAAGVKAALATPLVFIKETAPAVSPATFGSITITT
jgi:hypothetical protein